MKTIVNPSEITYLNIEDWRAEFFPNLHKSIAEEDNALSLTNDLKRAIAQPVDARQRKIEKTLKETELT
jgi:hypothetical protein